MKYSTESASSSFASHATKRKEGITVDETTTLDINKYSFSIGLMNILFILRSEDISDETKMEGSLEKRKTRRKVKCDTQSETKRKDKKMETGILIYLFNFPRFLTDDVDLSENNERLHLYSGSDSYDEGRNRSHSYHSDTSIAR